jgi:hypothetical protein
MTKVFALLAFASVSALAAEYTGTISDSACGAKHSGSSTACIQNCIRGGAEAVLVTADRNVVKIAATSKDKIMPFLGKKVIINGSVANGALTIESVKGPTKWWEAIANGNGGPGGGSAEYQPAAAMCPICPPRR